jgi:hypothetical protein
MAPGRGYRVRLAWRIPFEEEVRMTRKLAPETGRRRAREGDDSRTKVLTSWLTIVTRPGQQVAA